MKADSFNTEVSIYWDMLKNLSSEIKLELIAKLSSSLIHKEEDFETVTETGNWTEQFAGKWKDDRSADEILTIIV